MRQFRLLILFAVLCSAAFAYQYPIKDVKGLHSASFAEMRPDHFHSGVDIKTDGRQGKAVVAAADGYISRIMHSPFGYGLALYVTHPKEGSMTVYAHLSRFAEPLEQVVKSYRYEQRVNSVNLTFAPDHYPVKAGDVIAYSGNSGNSFGPHLHYELRDIGGRDTYNIVRRGLFRPKDSVAPQLLKLHYIEVDTLDGVAVEAPLVSYGVVKKGGSYTVSGSVKVGRNGYFLLECLDRQGDNATSRFGVYRVSQRVGGKKNFEYRMDGFSFAATRECDLVSYYPLQRSAKCEVIRLAQVAGASRDFYPVVVNRGAVSLLAGEQSDVAIEVEDDCGNISKLKFDIVGKADNKLFRPIRDPMAVVGGAGRAVEVAACGVRGYIGNGALYAPAFCSAESTDVRPEIEGVVVLSNAVKVLDENLPLKEHITVSIDACVPLWLQTKCCVARRGSKGTYHSVGGYYAARIVHTRVRSAGEFVAVADTLAPQIVPNWRSGADLRSATRISFKVTDNFTGVESYELYIDNEWKTLNYSPLQSTLYHIFDTPLAAGKKSTHTIRLKVIDGVGNMAIFEDSFFR